MSPTLKRRLKVFLAPLVTLLTLELALQVAFLVLQASSGDMPRNWITGHTRLLAIGDSHTFGLYVDAEEAYPARLEARWNEAYPERPITVLNFAYPGMNSFRVSDSIDSVMERFHPDAVLLMIGVNDYLTPVEQIATEGDSASSQVMRVLRQHSRLFDLVRMVKQSRGERADAQIERRELQWTDDYDERIEQFVKFKEANRGSAGHEVMRVGGEELVVVKEGKPARNISSLGDNLARIDAAVTVHGAELYLLTYGASAGFYEHVNASTREYASSNPVELIDAAAELVRHCPDSDACPNLFFEDLHPKVEGYTAVAAAVQERLARDWSLSD